MRALRVEGIHTAAGRLEMVTAAGARSLGAGMPGRVGAEETQQMSPMQCMGAVVAGWECPQAMPICREEPAGGQQSMVGRLPQARSAQAVSARTG